MHILTEIFGDYPRVKILSAFVENDSDMLYIADITRITNLSKMTVNTHINKLLKECIIQKTKKVGIIQYYQLNENNLKVKVVLEIVRKIAFQSSKNLDNIDVGTDDKEIVNVVSTSGPYSTQISPPYFSESTTSMNNLKQNSDY